MSNRSTNKAVILVAVVFVLGIALGSIATYVLEVRVWGQQLLSHHAIVMQELTHDVNLSADQQSAIAAIIKDTNAKYRMLYEPLDSEREAIRQQGRARIRAVLTPDQEPKYDEFVHHLDEERQKEARQK